MLLKRMVGKRSVGVAPGIPNVKVLLLGTDRPAINSSNNNNFIYWAPFCC